MTELSECRWPDLPEPYGQALREAVIYILLHFDPVGIIAAGSILRGSPSPSSDLDLYVIHHATRRKRLQKLFGRPPEGSPLPGVPAEIFVNPVQAIEGYFKEEQAEARPLTAHMFATGFVVLDRDPAVEALRRQARALLERPPAPGPANMIFLRYMAATRYEDALDILATDPEGAMLILCEAVYQMLHIAFRQAGRFLPRDKDLLPALQALDPPLASLSRQFYGISDPALKFSLAESLAARILGVTGFFEWESEFEEVA